MAAKKKSKKKTRAKKAPTKSKSAKKKRSTKKTAKKASRKKITARKKTAKRAASARKGPARVGSARRPARDTTFGSRIVPALPGDADSQGLSDVEQADSESVSELVDEGNAFEAGAVSGVQRADDSDEKEVRTREFSEDDVPEEYLDEQ